MIKRKKYLIAIHVPVHVSTHGLHFATDWLRSLRLLRDSFKDSFDQFTIVAPRKELNEMVADQHLITIDPEAENFTIIPSMDISCRARDYWLKERRRWRYDVTAALEESDVAHTGLSDLYRPINLDAFLVAMSTGKAVVFARDTDEVAKSEQLAASQGRNVSPTEKVYQKLYIEAMKYCVKRADLSLLKGDLLYNRYAKFARNPKIFEDTSYSRSEIVSWASIEQRLATLQSNRSIRLVYCGRIEHRKGVDHSVEIVARARAMGASVEFDIIGDGEDAGLIKQLIKSRKLGECVRLLGRRDYGPSLLSELATYDGYLFTPLAEDTPRAIFDGYAASLPLVAYGIEYVRERARKERATAMIEFGNLGHGAQVIYDLDKNRNELLQLAKHAHVAADLHCADNWYKLRAEWTLEAMERHHANQTRLPEQSTDC